jgi:hypothetical protein
MRLLAVVQLAQGLLNRGAISMSRSLASRQVSPEFIVAQSSPPVGDETRTNTNEPVRGPSSGQDEKSLGTQLRDAIRSGEDPWVAAGKLLKDSNDSALTTSSDPLLQFFRRYMEAASKANVPFPSSHREAIGNLKVLLKGMPKADSESLFKSAATIGLNLGFDTLKDSANRANVEPGLVAAFARSWKGEPQPPTPTPAPAPAPANTTTLAPGDGSIVPPDSGSGPSFRGPDNSGSSSGTLNRASGMPQPLTTASGDELTARWVAGESWFDIAAGLIADRAPGSIKLADIEGLPATPGLKEAVFALNVMREQGFVLLRSTDATGDGSRYAMRLQTGATQGPQSTADLGLVTSWNSLLGDLGVKPTDFQKALGDSAGSIVGTYNRLQAESAQVDQQRLPKVVPESRQPDV